MTNDFVILKNISVQAANCISGICYGFPSVTAFLGFAHAISRKLEPTEGISLTDVGILCHKHKVIAHRKSYFDHYRFSQKRTPPTSKGEPSPVNEEGMMNLTVSLVVRATGLDKTDQINCERQCEEIKNLAQTMTLAGGNVVKIDDCYSISTNCHKELLRPLLPFACLIEKSDLLIEKTSKGMSKLEAIIGTTTTEYKAETSLIPSTQVSADARINWLQTNKSDGYIVPIQVGFKALTRIFEGGEIENSRDEFTPLTFVEPIHTLGEWLRTPSRLDSIDELMWHYYSNHPFYLCQTHKFNSADEELDF
ncbi:type I-F CRISPR-associated protein Csy2 [Vibrio sp. D431a]|uniref:type I-F CRISPR-associated protein Csy2 n=1 Tax=Vibrio sp. D431a TaxID=2837388 RepID=UPI00255496EF|nr:type I-F CRISPR-associated protein Csy2 [Vibrio sp. D431a]MDK9790064.1 type I-F CRISPR-associated protein Csy2 [Vibrio sp. D431a]